VPLLSGFFSKDEILWQTFSRGHHKLWLLAVITAFLTATYMFRLLYMAFFGERRTPHEAPSTGHAAHGTAHRAHLHDAPPAMAIALVVLAIGSVAAGYVGVPDVLVRGGNRIEAFLEPSFHAPGEVAVAEPGAAAEQGSGSSEMTLMAVSTVVALAGIGLATAIYVRRPDTADRLAARFRPIYTLLLDKYYVDEIYDAVVVQPIKRLSTGFLWRGVDAGLVDGTVNGVGLVVRGWSAVLRRLQTGSVRTYATSLFLGVIVIVGYYLWR
jgi:NADH-quinone oxidoreductase subunit L